MPFYYMTDDIGCCDFFTLIYHKILQMFGYYPKLEDNKKLTPALQKKYDDL